MLVGHVACGWFPCHCRPMQPLCKLSLRVRQAGLKTRHLPDEPAADTRVARVAFWSQDENTNSIRHRRRRRR